MAASAEININSENTVEFTVNVGDVVKLCPPPGYGPMKFSTAQNNLFAGTKKDKKQYLKGFIVLKPDLGGLDPDKKMGDCVAYIHEKSGKQVIQYAARGLGDKYFYAIVSGITVHDHASVAQGGPAFATYFADVPEEE